MTQKKGAQNMNVEEERVQNVINGDSLLVLDDVVYYLALYTGDRKSVV